MAVNQSNNDQWLLKLTEEIGLITTKNVEEWGAMIYSLGIREEEDRNEWANIFKNHVEEFMNNLVRDVAETQEDLMNKLEQLLKESDNLCKQLNMKIPEYGQEDLGLYNEEKLLKEKVVELQKILDKRINDLEVIEKRRDNICDSLGKVPFKINKNPLPSQMEIEAYISRIEELEAEKIARKEKFKLIKYEILKLVDELHLVPSLDFERMVISAPDQSFMVTDANMKMLENFRESLVQQNENVKLEICNLREQVRHLWEILDEDLQNCDAFLQKHKGNCLNTLEAFKVELKRCEDLKKANIEVFVQKLRAELNDLWELCGFTEEQRTNFEYFYDDLYTEDLLSLHDIEINKLKTFYNSHKEIYELLAKREDLWSKMLKLEERSNAPDRYKNRGGQLLKEEKQRNALLKKIPEIESQLLELAAQYEIQTGKEFEYWGESIDLIIKKSHENYENDKKLKLSARKHQRDLTITPAKSEFNLGASTSNLSKLTPLKPSRLNYLQVPQRTPVSLPKKTMMTTPSSRKQETSRFGARSAPKMVISKTKLRYSTEKKKRMEKIRRLSKIVREKQKEETSTSSENFMDISIKDACRGKKLITSTPKKSKPPQKRMPTPKTPQSNRNMTVGPSLKLIF